MATDDKAKQRIIDHMNRDHQRELSHYLRHFCSVSRSDARDPAIRDITLTTLTVRARARDYTVPIHPPLVAWADARARFVEMDASARAALGIPDLCLDVYRPPHGFQRVVFGAVAVYFLCAATLPWTLPGTAVWRALDAVFPGGAETYAALVRRIFWPTIGVHVTEMVLLEYLRLRPYGVERFSPMWWKWEASCFVEGFGTFVRTRKIMESKRAEKEAKSH